MKNYCAKTDFVSRLLADSSETIVGLVGTPNWWRHMVIGDKAFELVREYSALGFHRTGSSGDRATLRWLKHELAVRGADVSFQTFLYDHFDAELSVRIAGRLIDAMALHFSITGKHQVCNPATGVVDAHADEAEIAQKINGMVALAKSDGRDGLIVATQCPTDTLCAINREYSTDLQFPVILVAQADCTSIQASGVEIQYSATIRKSKATNIIARFPGPLSSRRVVVTTPISGWFQCAGERGCGLAVAIIVAKQLSRNFTVDLLLANGHELSFLGGYHLAERYAAASGYVLHIGSCIANFDAQMTSICSSDPATTSRIAASLQMLGIMSVAQADPASAGNWVGESKCWASKSWPMLSIAGQAPHFHTSNDLPDAVTAPNLLAVAIDAIYTAAVALATDVSGHEAENTIFKDQIA